MAMAPPSSTNSSGIPMQGCWPPNGRLGRCTLSGDTLQKIAGLQVQAGRGSEQQPEPSLSPPPSPADQVQRQLASHRSAAEAMQRLQGTALAPTGAAAGPQGSGQCLVTSAHVDHQFERRTAVLTISLPPSPPLRPAAAAACDAAASLHPGCMVLLAAVPAP